MNTRVMKTINYQFIAHKQDQNILYFNDMKYNTCVCMIENEFTVEGLINKIIDRHKAFSNENNP